MWELDYKESWVLKNWCFWTLVLEKTLESPLDCKEIQPVHPKGNQSWIFIGRTDAEGETKILWPPWCEELTHWKRPWCWERLKVGGEGYNRGWDGWMASPTWWTWVCPSFGSWWWTRKPGMLHSPWGRKELDTTEQLNWTELNWTYLAASFLTLPGGHVMFHSWWMMWIYYYISLLYAFIATSLFALDIPLASSAYAWKSASNSVSSLVGPGVRWGKWGTQDAKFWGTQDQVSDCLYFMLQGPHALYAAPGLALWCLPCYTPHLHQE